MQLRKIIGILILVSGCSTADVDIDAMSGLVVLPAWAVPSEDSVSLEKSTKYCKYGACSVSPVVMMVIGKAPETDQVRPAALAGSDAITGFIFSGTTKYDGRLSPKGAKYLAYRDPDGQLVCQGYYNWSGFGRTSDVKLRCFDDSAEVKGTLRNYGRQKTGQFRGKGVGTGVLSFDGGLIAVVYGIDPPELKGNTFDRLWVKYGGIPGELPLASPRWTKNAPLLNQQADKKI